MDHAQPPAPAGPGDDQALLEHLFVLTINGQQASRDFARIQQQVHERLLAAYRPDPGNGQHDDPLSG